MMLRRTVLSLGLVLPFGGTARAAEEAAGPAVGDTGLYTQPWFADTFLEMGPDLEEAASGGRGLMVLFEQQGCPYCRELHRVNFARPEITGEIEQNWMVVQLDLWGAREVVDFDGEALEERDLARKWAVNFTPTTVLFPPEGAGADDRAKAESFRMPGYFKPCHYLAGLEYGGSDQWEETPFQRFLQGRFEEYRAKGLEPDVW